MSPTDIAQIGGLILAAIAAIGGAIKFILSLQSGGDLVADLRTQLAEAKQEIKDLREELDEERDAREAAGDRHREDLDMLRREHRAEIEGLQREVRDLMARRT